MKKTAIVKLEIAHIAQIMAIQKACYASDYHESEQSFISKIEHEPDTCFLALQEGVAVGYLIAFPAKYLMPPPLNNEQYHKPLLPDCLHLHDLAVLPNVRGMKWGEKLVAAFLAKMQQLAINKATLVAVQGSSDYWQRFGFNKLEKSAAIEEILLSYSASSEYMVLCA